MERVFKHLIFIFYFPLVILTFVLVFYALVDLLAIFTDTTPRVIITDGSFVYGQPWAYFENRRIEAPQRPFIAGKEEKDFSVLSAQAPEKWIDINLSTQTLTAFESDGGVFMQVPISSGLWAPTPTGSFRIWIKLRYTKMSGGSRALGTYYYLPNVPCTQYFYKGYGVHGTYWHNNFGQPMSHGCVNMRTPDACQLFEWTSPPISSGVNVAYPSGEYPGTNVVVHY